MSAAPSAVVLLADSKHSCGPRSLRLRGGCGIVGAVLSDTSHLSTSKARQALQCSLDRLWHRGPDGFAVHCLHPNVLLGHTRLAINDAPGGDQPFVDKLGRALVANAEIYNFEEVLASLPTPPECRSTSDCEAILHAYGAWGIDCLQRLRGMFAFIIDDGRSSVFAARDPLGIKPLFFGTNGRGETWFASEVHALSDHCSEIRSVPPGHFWHNDSLHAYYTPAWLPAPSVFVQPREDAIGELGRV